MESLGGFGETIKGCVWIMFILYGHTLPLQPC